MYGYYSVKFLVIVFVDDNNDDGDDESVGGDDVNYVFRYVYYKVLFCRFYKRVLYKNWD